MQEKITEILQKHKIILGYLFGSHVRGTANTSSDIDVAVLFSQEISINDQEMEISLIRSEIQNAFSVDRVDVINLNTNKNPVLRRDIFFGGILLLSKNDTLKKNLERKSVRDYEDTRFIRDVQFKILKQKFNVTN